MKKLLQEISLPFAMLFLVGSMVFYQVARVQYANAHTLAHDQGHASALLTNKSTQATTRRDKDGTEREGPITHVLHYEYAHPETGQIWICTASTDKTTWEGMEVGRHYEMIFSKANPQLTSLFGGHEFQSGAKLAERLAQVSGILGIGFLLVRYGRHWMKA